MDRSKTLRAAARLALEFLRVVAIVVLFPLTCLAALVASGAAATLMWQGDAEFRLLIAVPLAAAVALASAIGTWAAWTRRSLRQLTPNQILSAARTAFRAQVKQAAAEVRALPADLMKIQRDLRELAAGIGILAVVLVVLVVVLATIALVIYGVGWLFGTGFKAAH